MRRTRTSAILLTIPLGLTALLAACAVEEPTTSTPGASSTGGGSIKGTGEVVVACTPQEEQCQAMADLHYSVINCTTRESLPSTLEGWTPGTGVWLTSSNTRA